MRRKRLHTKKVSNGDANGDANGDCALQLAVKKVSAVSAVPSLRDVYGSAKATMLLPDGAPFLPPPQTMTTYCLPLMV